MVSHHLAPVLIFLIIDSMLASVAVPTANYSVDSVSLQIRAIISIVKSEGC